MAGQASLPGRVLFIDMGTQVERERRGEGERGEVGDARWWRGKWEMGRERPRPCICRAHPNTAATEGKTATLIHFATYKLSRNIVINHCQSRLSDGRLRGRFGWPTSLGFGTSLAA